GRSRPRSRGGRTRPSCLTDGARRRRDPRALFGGTLRAQSLRPHDTADAARKGRGMTRVTDPAGATNATTPGAPAAPETDDPGHDGHWLRSFARPGLWGAAGYGAGPPAFRR